MSAQLHVVEDDATWHAQHVAELDETFTSIARVLATTAIEMGLSAQYAPVLGHVVKARRALRDAFPA